MPLTYKDWYNSIDRSDPELRVDSSVCSCTWEPPTDTAARKEHIKSFHPYWVTCVRCDKTWRYTDAFAWEGKFEGEQLRGHEVDYGVDKPEKPVNLPEPTYSDPVECVLTTGHWVALGAGVSARVHVRQYISDAEDLSGMIEFRIGASGPATDGLSVGTTFQTHHLSYDDWFDVTPLVQVKRVWTNCISARTKES